MSINQWPKLERPREKLLSQGAAALSDAELLAIFLRTGVKGSSAVDIARQMMNHFGSLSNILNASLEAFQNQPGLGIAKYAQLIASKELTRRALAEELKLGDAFTNPAQVKTYLRLTIADRDVEVFVAIFLSAQNRIIAVEEIFRGTFNEAYVYPREIVRKGLFHNAAAMIVAHNHPAGHTKPSTADRQLTHKLKTSLAMMEIRLLDHFVVAGQEVTSFAEQGWL